MAIRRGRRLTGVYWHTDGGSSGFSGHGWLSVRQRRLFETKSEIAAIVPTSSSAGSFANDFRRDRSDPGFIDDTQVRFRSVTRKLLAGRSKAAIRITSNYYQKRRSFRLYFSATDFRKNYKGCEPVCARFGGSVTVTVDDEKQQISVHSIASGTGWNTSTGLGENYGKWWITLNSRYIADALNVIDGDTVSLSFTGKLSPCVLTTDEKTQIIPILLCR